MRQHRILLVEDDPHQRRAIVAALRQRLAGAGPGAEIVTADSERNARLMFRGRTLEKFDAYVIDMMVPWSQDDEDDDRDDPRVDRDGSLYAGVRIIEDVVKVNGAAKPIFAYTIANADGVSARMRHLPTSIRYLRKGDTDKELADAVAAALLTSKP
ncbi:MAG: response regulator [Alphaproteobacteria bacterium]|nr:response regulator [Alphaproteobacteria bacterium]